VAKESKGTDSDQESGFTESGRRLLLFGGRKYGPVANIAIRLAVAIGALVIAALLVYSERACYEDNGVLGDITLIDAFYYATVSLSTTGYGDIAPVCQSARLANILIITPLRFIFLIVLIGTTIEVLTRKTRQEWRTRNWRKHVENHTIVVGYGVKGRSAARSLRDAGYDGNSIVVVAPDRDSVDLATRDGLVGIVGDGRSEEVLRDAAVEKAGRVIIATDEDDTSVLVTLTARRLARPTCTIVAAVRESQNADILRQSGATNVIPTAESAGRLMGLSVISNTAGEIMEDLLDSTRGLEVIERDITREELGLSPSQLDARGQLVLAVIRHGQAHRFDTDVIRQLESGDRLVVIQNSHDH
jgi:voltage-gated potassium channel